MQAEGGVFIATVRWQGQRGGTAAYGDVRTLYPDPGTSADGDIGFLRPSWLGYQNTGWTGASQALARRAHLRD
jgi:hypothetical protein